MFLIGYLLDKHFSLDVRTYDIVTRYAVMPLFIFLSLYRHIPSHVTLIPAAFAGILCLSGLLGWLLQKILPEEGTIRDFISPFMLSDTELTGVVFLILVFSHVPYFTGMGNPKTFIIPFVSVASLLLLTSMIIHSVLLAGRRTHSLTEMIRAFFSVPSLYTAVAAVLLRSFNIPLEHSFLWPVLLHYDGVFVILTCIMTGIWFHKSYSPEFKWAPALLMLVRFVLILGISYAVIHFSGIFSPAESHPCRHCAHRSRHQYRNQSHSGFHTAIAYYLSPGVPAGGRPGQSAFPGNIRKVDLWLFYRLFPITYCHCLFLSL